MLTPAANWLIKRAVDGPIGAPPVPKPAPQPAPAVSRPGEEALHRMATTALQKPISPSPSAVTTPTVPQPAPVSKPYGVTPNGTAEVADISNPNSNFGSGSAWDRGMRNSGRPTLPTFSQQAAGLATSALNYPATLAGKARGAVMTGLGQPASPPQTVAPNGYGSPGDAMKHLQPYLNKQSPASGDAGYQLGQRAGLWGSK